MIGIPGRGRALRQSLRVSAVGDVAEGFYSFITNERVLSLGQDGADPRSRMVSLHEHLHAVLNAGTTFGSCLLVASSLAEASLAGFDKLTSRLIESCVLTHESYATFSSVYSLSKGRLNLDLLQEFPEYRELIDAFAASYDITAQPYVAAVCIDACARAAMQTNLAEHWARLPCETWLLSPLEGIQRPDVRFERCLQSDFASILVATIKNSLASLEAPFCRLAEPTDPEEEAAVISAAQTSTLETVQRAAFEALARLLTLHGGPTAGFDDNRSISTELVQKIEAFAGDSLKRRFVVSQNRTQDYLSTLFDFRRERLVNRANPDSSVVLPILTVDDELLDILGKQTINQRYLQLVAMPRAKGQMLYQARVGAEILSGAGEHLTLLRRRLPPAPAYPDGLIVLATLDGPAELRRVTSRVGNPPIRAVISASTYLDDEWRGRWLPSDGSLIDSLSVIIDVDPFSFVRQLSQSNSVQMAKIVFEWGTLQRLSRNDILVVFETEWTNRVFFTPCSGVLFEALSTVAQIEMPNVSLCNNLSEAVKDIVVPALSHALNEESRFGFEFWR